MGVFGQRALDPLSAPGARVGGPRSAALTVRGAEKSYGSHPVLTGLDLTVESGQLVSIVGANGVGKTTLLRIAAGIVEPERGSVTVGGIDLRRGAAACRGRIGFLSAGDRGLYPRLSVRRNLEFAARLGLLERRRLRPAVAAAIERLGLAELAMRRVDRLSTGQRQRVRLAMTLIHDPHLVLLDEPLNSLDEVGVRLLGGALAGVIVRGGAVVWCAPSGGAEALPVDRRYAMRGGVLEPA
jgi:ABC-type multidrug transport system ATPase subunit